MTQPDRDPVAGVHHVTAVSGDPDANRRGFRETLGGSPKLPSWLEGDRERIESALPEPVVDADTDADAKAVTR